MVYAKGTIDTSVKGNASGGLSLTNETIVTLDIILTDGTHNNSRCELQHSPDNGVNWFSSGDSTNGTGTITEVLSTSMVRVCVLKGEGSDAQATYFLTAK